MSDTENAPSQADYLRAGYLIVRLASIYDPGLASEGRSVAERMLAHVKSQVEDFQAFVARVDRSEELALHESARVDKKELPLKLQYTRAMDLLDTVAEAEALSRKKLK